MKRVGITMSVQNGLHPRFPVLTLLLASLILLLCILDAPEYVHCTHLGVCEFLELTGDVASSQKAEWTEACLVHYSYPPPWSRISSSQNVDLSGTYSALYCCPDRYSDKEILSLPSREKGDILILQDHHSHCVIRYLPSQSLQIISTSLIKS